MNKEIHDKMEKENSKYLGLCYFEFLQLSVFPYSQDKKELNQNNF